MPAIPQDRTAPVAAQLVSSPKTKGFGPEVFGSQLGESFEQAGKVATLAFDMENKANVTDALAQYNSAVTNTLYDGENGVLGKTEKDALDNGPKAIEALNKARNDIEAKLGNDAQKAAFRTLAMERHATAQKTVEQHVMGQRKAWEKKSGDAFMQTEITDAIRNPDNKEIQERTYRSITATILSQNPGVDVKDPVVQAQLTEVRSKLHGGMLAQLISDKRFKEATVYMADHKAEMDPGVATQLNNILKPRAIADEVDGKAQELIDQSLKGQDQNFVPDIESLTKQARDIYPDDKERRDALVLSLRDMQGTREKGIKDRNTNDFASVLGDIQKNGYSLNRVQGLPNFQRLPGDLRLKVEELIEQENWSDEGKAITRENRARGNTAWNKAAIAEQREGTFYKVISDDTYGYAKMSDDEFMAYLPQLGPQRFHDLSKARESLRSPEALATMKLDKTDIREALRSMGLNVNSTKKKDLAEVQRYTGIITSKLLEIQGEEGVAMGRGEKRKWIRQLATQVPTVESGWFGPKIVNKPLVDVGNYKDIHVPVKDHKEIYSKFRSAGIPARKVTMDMIRHAYIKRLGR